MNRVRCVRCNDVIGVYEPMVVILAGGGRYSGSPLTLKAELEEPRNIAIHEQCWDAREDGQMPEPTGLKRPQPDS